MDTGHRISLVGRRDLTAPVNVLRLIFFIKTTTSTILMIFRTVRSTQTTKTKRIVIKCYANHFTNKLNKIIHKI